MNTINLWTKYLLISVFFLICSISLNNVAHAFDNARIGAAKNAAGDMVRHMMSGQAGYYGYALNCIQTDILNQRDQMDNPGVQKKAKDCISYYRTGFENLNPKYDDWEEKSRELRDALQNEK